MNVNEYGVILQFGVSFNMVSNTDLTLVFTKPDLDILTVDATLGTLTVDTPEGTFLANTYATYTFVEGDVDQVGDWQVRLIYDDAAPTHLISTIGHFTVYP